MGEPRFNRSLRYKDKKGRKFGKGVWLGYNRVIQPGWGDFNRKDRTVTQYNTDGTKTVFSWEQWQNKKTKEHELKVLQNDRKYAIPFIPSKKITITIDKNSPTRKNAGAVISENLLDSVASNASKARIPFSTALGMVAQESTLGNNASRSVGKTMLPWLYVLNNSKGMQKDAAVSIPYDNVQSPSLLISNWKRISENPFAIYNYDGQGDLLKEKRNDDYYNEYFNSDLRKSNKYTMKDVSPLFHGFREYKKNPKKWNENDPDYPNKVEAQKNELINYSPEIKTYMKKHNLHSDGGEIKRERGKGEYASDVVISSLNPFEYGLGLLSAVAMESGRRGKFIPHGFNVAQNSYLVPSRSIQAKMFKDAGYVRDYTAEKNRDYGLVKKAVGERNLPIYSRVDPNTGKQREDLIVLGNANEIGNVDNPLIHAGHFPSAIYSDTEGNLYTKSWDLNDYGGDSAKYKGLRKVEANLVDFLGNPVVVTTGYQKAIDDDGNNLNINNVGNYTSDHTYKDVVDNWLKKNNLELNEVGLGSPEIEINAKRNTKKYGDGGYLGNDWDSLSYRDKAEMIKVAIDNGITTLPEIRKAYNEFAKGGKMNWTIQDEAGYRYWRSRLPRNLRETNDNDYDMRAAYKVGMEPQWNNEDKSYHLGSRDPKSGRILKSAHHPTFLKALVTDASLGYYPTTDYNGNTYTETWKGNSYGGGGYMPSTTLRKSIANWEGASMKTNRSFEAEAKDFNRVIPSEIRSKLSSNQLDALYSYGYNVGMGKLKERVLPTLTAYTQGKATKEDVQRSMWATKDSQLRGLTRRRNWEREMFGGNYRTTFDSKNIGIHVDPTSFQLPQGFFNDTNAMINTEIPQMQFPDSMNVDPSTMYKVPIIDDTLFANPKTPTKEVVYSPKQEKLDNIQTFNTVMGLLGQSTPFTGLVGDSKPGLLSYINAIYST